MVAATALFDATLAVRVGERARRWATVWFAVGGSVALLSSRVPFDLGLAVGLAAVLAAQRRRTALAVALAVLTSLASPVAGAFLGMAMLAWALATPAPRTRLFALALCALALAPIVLLAVAFPEGGSQPFVGSAFWPALVGVVVVGAAIPPQRRELRIGALLYGAVLIGSFVVPSAVGGNADRLGALATGPVAAAALAGSMTRWRRRLLVALVAPLTYWQVNAPVTDYVSTLSNPATEAAYYRPLLGELARLGVGYGHRPSRIEVVPTVDHWEARYVATSVMIARGWERQLDRLRNGLFYGSSPPAAAAYERWLQAQAISYVALPDASLDYSGKGEARLLESGSLAGTLAEVWSSAHWRLFAVLDPAPLVSGAARLLQAGRQSFTVRAPAAGAYTVRLRWTQYWLPSSGCVERAPEGWTTLRTSRAGTVHVVIGFSLGRVLSRGERCAGPIV